MFYYGAGCSGRQRNDALGGARSRKLLGRREKNPRNSVVAGNEHWK